MLKGNERPALLAGTWYPGARREIEKAVRAFLTPREAVKVEGKAHAAIAPHAGWAFCGHVMGAAIGTLKKHCDPPQSVVCFGAVHVPGVPKPNLFASGSWATPLGKVEVDAELAEVVLGKSGEAADADPGAHFNEHSIEVQLAFIQTAFPRARILPVMCPPTEDSIALGNRVAAAAESLGRPVVAVSSTDLTHYGRENFGWAPAGSGPEALTWAREENDAPLIAAMEAMDADAVLKTSGERRNSCGAGAVAAGIAFAKARGAKRGWLVDYSTSADAGRPSPLGNFVSYAGIVFGD